LSGPQQFSFANAIEQKATSATHVDFQQQLSSGVVVEEKTIAQPAVRAEPRRKSSTPTPAQPINVLKLAKARLREVQRELKRAKELDKERIELERLIAAATGSAPKND
jgi:hypothetical protein